MGRKASVARKALVDARKRVNNNPTSTLTRDEAEEILTAIARGEVCDSKQTARGDVIEIPPSNRDRKDAIALFAKLKGWMGEEEEKDNRVKVGILKPQPAAQEPSDA